MAGRPQDCPEERCFLSAPRRSSVTSSSANSVLCQGDLRCSSPQRPPFAPPGSAPLQNKPRSRPQSERWLRPPELSRVTNSAESKSKASFSSFCVPLAFKIVRDLGFLPGQPLMAEKHQREHPPLPRPRGGPGTNPPRGEPGGNEATVPDASEMNPLSAEDAVAHDPSWGLLWPLPHPPLAPGGDRPQAAAVRGGPTVQPHRPLNN